MPSASQALFRPVFSKAEKRLAFLLHPFKRALGGCRNGSNCQRGIAGGTEKAPMGEESRRSRDY